MQKIFVICTEKSIFASFNQPNNQHMKHIVLFLALLSMIPATALAQVGIGTTSPATTLHLFHESDYPVLRIEGGPSTPEHESGRVEWVSNESGVGKGYSMRIVDGEFWINRLTDGSLAKQDYPAIRLDPEFFCLNVRNGTGQVTKEVNLSVNGSLAAGNRTITTDYAMPPTGETEDYVILADATSGNITVTLCPASGQKGRILIFKKIAGNNSVIIDANNSETIDGSLQYWLSTIYQSITIQSDGSNWYIIGK
jgi:hypothetical protein